MIILYPSAVPNGPVYFVIFFFIFQLSSYFVHPGLWQNSLRARDILEWEQGC
jgi:hypothetical protein